MRAYLAWRGAHAFRDTFACETYVEMDGATRRLDDAVLRELWLENTDFGHAPTKAFFEDVVENEAREDHTPPGASVPWWAQMGWGAAPR